MCSSCVHPPTLYSRLASCLCFLGRVFQALRMFRGFLLFFWPSYQSVYDLFQSGAVSGLLVLWLLGFPVLSSPCGVSRLTKLSLFLSVPRFLMDWKVSSSVLFGGVPLSPPVHRPSLGWPTRSISLLCLSLFFWSVLGGAALRIFLLLAFRSVAVPLVFYLLLVVCSCLLSPVGQWVLQGLRVFACPCVRGGSSQGCPCSVSSVCIGSAPFLPSSPPPVSYGLVVVLSPRWAPPLRVYWLSHPTMVPLWFCALLSVSNLAYPSVVVVLFSSSIFVSSSVCLRRSCSLVPLRWGHPGLGRVSVLVSSTRSERRLSLLAHLYSFGMGSPFGSSVFYILP